MIYGGIKLKSYKIWHTTDFPGEILYKIDSSTIPKALPWIEPSINCLHLESVLSYLVGNYQCAIMSMGALLEHVLRLALINKNQCGYDRNETIHEIDKYQSLSKIIDVAKDKDIFRGCNESWWYAVAKIIRNKSAHYLLPLVLTKCAETPELKKYINDYNLPENNDKYTYETCITDWGSFYHKSGRKLAELFLIDATEQIRIVISNTNWSGDESWWISQRNYYEAFFSYDWTADNIEQSIKDCRK